jgi:transposase-like protein
MKRVPNSNHVTEVLCNKFSGYLLVDAKYVSVRGNDKKLAFIWTLDYYTHDVIWYMLASSENTQAYYAMFTRLKKIGYQLNCLICDDHATAQNVVKLIYPKAKIQLCLTHYKRNIQKMLELRRNDCDRAFFKDILRLFMSKDEKEFNGIGKWMIQTYGIERKYRQILMNIDQNTEVLTTYLKFKNCPSTTNLIECYNKHLSGRLKTIDGFKSYETAEL